MLRCGLQKIRCALVRTTPDTHYVSVQVPGDVPTDAEISFLRLHGTQKDSFNFLSAQRSSVPVLGTGPQLIPSRDENCLRLAAAKWAMTHDAL